MFREYSSPNIGIMSDPDEIDFWGADDGTPFDDFASHGMIDSLEAEQSSLHNFILDNRSRDQIMRVLQTIPYQEEQRKLNERYRMFQEGMKRGLNSTGYSCPQTPSQSFEQLSRKTFEQKALQEAQREARTVSSGPKFRRQ